MSLLVLITLAYLLMFVCFFFFKQKTAYELRISDWSSDVCSSDLANVGEAEPGAFRAQDPREPRAIALRIDARQTLARRADQPFILIEAQRAGGDPELGRQVGDAELLAPQIDRKSTRLNSSH